jgi:hypothetical protein
LLTLIVFNNNTQRVLSFSGFWLIVTKKKAMERGNTLKNSPVLILGECQQDLCGRGNSISAFVEDASRLILPARTASYNAAMSGKSSD